MCRPSASGVHATCGDYRSIGIERITAGEVIDGRWVMLWRHPLYGRWRRIIERAAWKSPSMLRHGNNAVSYLTAIARCATSG